jgi:glutamyl-tRNA synthetase
MPNVRSRFAPSPTGYLHIGGARTALFSYLFARGRGGTFLLRIEDTDRERSTSESVQAIFDGLRWLRIDWDEGPFFQSQRTNLYKKAVEELIRRGGAYRCYCGAEELDRKREAALREGRKPAYDRTCRNRTDRPDRPFAIRFRAPEWGETAFQDIIKGRVAFQNEELDDLIIARSDGSPTYNFCVVVDDVTMEITHVIRGNDHLSNTPKQILCYEALGYPLPVFAHIPMILGPDRKRLSKRHGATSVLAFRDEGFLPEAMVNYFARLGWAHGDQEVFTRDELIQLFDLRDVGATPAIFDRTKLEWLNQVWMKRLAEDPADRQRLAAQALAPHVERLGIAAPADRLLLAAVATLTERAKTLAEMAEQGRFYFEAPAAYDPDALRKLLTAATAARLDRLLRRLQGLEPWDTVTLEGAFRQLAAELGVKLVDLAQPVRLALSGRTASPPLFDVMAVLGPEETLGRLRALRRQAPAG